MSTERARGMVQSIREVAAICLTAECVTPEIAEALIDLDQMRRELQLPQDS